MFTLFFFFLDFGHYLFILWFWQHLLFLLRFLLLISINFFASDFILILDNSLTFDINCNIKDRDVIIVEDIIDTGLTINFINDHIKQKKPNSISIATLLFKKDRAQLNFDVDYIGFNIPLEFVVGYGMDYNKKLRNLDSIFLLEQKDLVF